MEILFAENFARYPSGPQTSNVASDIKVIYIRSGSWRYTGSSATETARLDYVNTSRVTKAVPLNRGNSQANVVLSDVIAHMAYFARDIPLEPNSFYHMMCHASAPNSVSSGAVGVMNASEYPVFKVKRTAVGGGLLVDYLRASGSYTANYAAASDVVHLECVMHTNAIGAVYRLQLYIDKVLVSDFTQNFYVSKFYVKGPVQLGNWIIAKTPAGSQIKPIFMTVGTPSMVSSQNASITSATLTTPVEYNDSAASTLHDNGHMTVGVVSSQQLPQDHQVIGVYVKGNVANNPNAPVKIRRGLSEGEVLLDPVVESKDFFRMLVDNASGQLDSVVSTSTPVVSLTSGASMLDKNVDYLFFEYATTVKTSTSWELVKTWVVPDNVFVLDLVEISSGSLTYNDFYSNTSGNRHDRVRGGHGGNLRRSKLLVNPGDTLTWTLIVSITNSFSVPSGVRRFLISDNAGGAGTSVTTRYGDLSPFTAALGTTDPSSSQISHGGAGGYEGVGATASGVGAYNLNQISASNVRGGGQTSRTGSEPPTSTRTDPLQSMKATTAILAANGGGVGFNSALGRGTSGLGLLLGGVAASGGSQDKFGGGLCGVIRFGTQLNTNTVLFPDHRLNGAVRIAWEEGVQYGNIVSITLSNWKQENLTTVSNYVSIAYINAYMDGALVSGLGIDASEHRGNGFGVEHINTTSTNYWSSQARADSSAPSPFVRLLAYSTQPFNKIRIGFLADAVAQTIGVFAKTGTSAATGLSEPILPVPTVKGEVCWVDIDVLYEP